MLRGAEAVGQELAQGQLPEASALPYQIDRKVIPAEFPHHLAAHPAGREGAADHTVLSAADGDGGEVTVAVEDRLEDVTDAYLVRCSISYNI